MANNTGLIIGVSVLGVAVIGVSVYLITRKKDTSATVAPPVIRPNYPMPNPNIGGSTATQPINNTNNNDWWKGIASSVGSNLGNQLVDSIFKPKPRTNTSSSGYSSGFNVDKPSTWSDDDMDRWLDE